MMTKMCLTEIDSEGDFSYRNLLKFDIVDETIFSLCFLL